MKKLIILLTLFSYIQVQATSYTEYEFVGYQETQPFVDELTKYETLTKHRYYENIYGEFTKLDLYDSQKDTYDYCELLSKTEHIERIPSSTYPNESYIILKGTENYNVTEINIQIDSPELNIQNINLKINDILTPVDYLISSNTISMQLNSIPIDDLEIIFDYLGSGYLTINIEGKTSNRIGIMLSLDERSNRATINPLSLEKIQALGYGTTKLQYLYKYTEETYNCTNYERNYITEDEYDYTKEYLYDEKEDITIYKVYKREKIESLEPDTPIKPDDSIEQDNSIEPEDPKLPTEKDQKPSPYEPPLEDIPSNDDIKTSEKPSYNESISQNSSAPIVSNDTIKFIKPQDKQLEKKENEEDMTATEHELDKIAFLDKDQIEKNSTNEEGFSICEEQTQTLKEIKLLLLILIILTIVHTIQLLYVNTKS